MKIRAATDADIPAITAIFNHAIAEAAPVGQDTPVTGAERGAWLADRHAAGYPVFVTVAEGDEPGAAGDAVTGFASFGPWRDGNGYRHTVELSIYVHADHQGEGVGTQLLEKLIEEARAQGRHVMIAAIESQNEASIELHRGYGFDEAGRYREVGARDDEWLDLTAMQLVLGRPKPDRNT